MVLPLAGFCQQAFHLPAVIADHMVLQQQARVTLWGTAPKGSQVQVAPGWTGKKFTAAADAEGNWQLKVPTPKAGGPYQLVFTNNGTSITVRDVLLGEVWVCSGQSNMAMPLKGYKKQPVQNAAEIIADAANHPDIHVFLVPKAMSATPLTGCKGSWQVASAATAPDFSAVAYEYARILNNKLHVPVGIISTYWGGTAVQSWMSEKNLAQFPEVWTTNRPDTITDPEYNPEHSPAILFNAMILPLTRYSIKGFVWYQGESNRAHPLLYRRLFPAMVKEWRALWGSGRLPFYYVQIAPYGYYDPRHENFPAIVRESQLLALHDIPHAGMAVTLDIGKEKYIHPPDKTTVSERLSYWALAKTYHKKGIAFASPVFKKMKIKGREACLYFDFAKNGLTANGQSLENFEMAGSDHVFHHATAAIVHHNRVKVACDSVPVPVAVRYAFHNWVKGDLYNGAGLPASSFRTDR